MTAFTESVVEQAALGWLESIGWRILHGAQIAPGEPAAERGDYRQVVLMRRLRGVLPSAASGLGDQPTSKLAIGRAIN